MRTSSWLTTSLILLATPAFAQMQAQTPDSQWGGDSITTAAWPIATQGYRQPTSSSALPTTQSLDECTCAIPNAHPIPLQAFTDKLQPRPLCFDSFALIYSTVTKTPLLAYDKVSPDVLAQMPAFTRAPITPYPDPRLDPAGQGASTNSHATPWTLTPLVPSEHQVFEASYRQTFSLSNYIPMSATARNQWKKIHQRLRAYATPIHKTYYIVSGPLFEGKATFLPSGARVPSHLFIAYQDAQNAEPIAYIIDNMNHNNALEKQVSYKDLIARLGYNPF